MEFHGNQFSGFVKTTLHEQSSTFLFDICTIDESIKGAASQNRYGITFDGNIDVLYIFRWLSIYEIVSYLKMEKKP